jgi:hypothetical protein
MALRDLKSSLKNLRVDKDRPFGGSSGLPYIKGGLPEDSPAGEYLADLARYSSEGTVRGGLFSVVSSETDRARVSRFLNDFPKGLLFTSKQIGLQKSNPKIETETRGEVLNTQVYSNSNLLAQIALQGNGQHVPRPGFNTNDLLRDENKYEKIVRDKTTDENRLVTLYNNKIAPASSKILPDNIDKLGISTLDNELFNYAGGPGSSYGDGDTFIPRVVNTTTSYNNYTKNGFSNPTYDPSFSISLPEDGVINYLNSLGLTDLIKTKSILGLRDLLYPKKKKEFVAPTSFSPATTLGNASLQTPFVASNIDLSGGVENIDFEEGDYLQNTKVPKSRYQQASPNFIRPEKVPEGYTFGNTMAYSKLVSSIPEQLQDFRQFTINSQNGIPTPQGKGYSSSSVEINSRLNMGNPGARKQANLKSINDVNEGIGQDKINLIPLYTYNGKDPDPIQGNKVRDMIKFCIEVIDNDSPSKTSPLHFRAYVTDFSDNIGADWNGQKYMGRGENFYTYQGFTREVSFKLTIAAQSKQEMMPLYQKLNFLASSLHPDYSSGGFMRGNLHKLTIGEWFYRTPGILKSMNISIDNNYPWEIKYTEPETEGKFKQSDFPKNLNMDKLNTTWKNGTSKANQGSTDFEKSNSDADQMELPQILSISFTFTPILNNLPRLAKDNNSKFTQTPILISDHGIKENFIKRITN